MKRSQFLVAQKRATEMLAAAGVVLTESERANIEVADFGLGRLKTEGLELLIYVNNERYCAKELVLFPGQTCPQHRHPPVEGHPGKQETFRCRCGLVWLYVQGPSSANPQATLPPESGPYYTVFHEIELHPGEQHTKDERCRRL